MAMPQCCYLAKGAKRPSHTTNTINFDCIPFDPCNSIKRFDLRPFDRKNSTYLQPPLKMVSVNVMFTSRTCEYYRQIDGVGMSSPVGPLLANIFLSQYNSEIALHSKLYFRCVDDIVRTMIRGGENPLLQFVNTLHSNLRITLEKAIAEHGLPFLDLELKKVENSIASNWYRKKTDTGIVLNFHATVPKIKLSGIVSGFVHRIFYSTSNWVNFHSSW